MIVEFKVGDFRFVKPFRELSTVPLFASLLADITGEKVEVIDYQAEPNGDAPCELDFVYGSITVLAHLTDQQKINDFTFLRRIQKNIIKHGEDDIPLLKEVWKEKFE